MLNILYQTIDLRYALHIMVLNSLYRTIDVSKVL